MDSSGNEVESLISEIVIRVASLARAKFNMGLVLSEIIEREIGFSIQSLIVDVLSLLAKLIYVLMQKRKSFDMNS